MNSYSTSWWSLLLINRPREDERLSWLTYSGRFTHINGPVQTSESSLVRDRCSTTEPPNQSTFHEWVTGAEVLKPDILPVTNHWLTAKDIHCNSSFLQPPTDPWGKERQLSNVSTHEIQTRETRKPQNIELTNSGPARCRSNRAIVVDVVRKDRDWRSDDAVPSAASQLGLTHWWRHRRSESSPWRHCVTSCADTPVNKQTKISEETHH